MEIKTGSTNSGLDFASEYRCVMEDGIDMSHGTFITKRTRFNGEYIKSVLVGGVGTEPEYRRGGLVRMLIEDMIRSAPSKGWVVSLLHPFSFAFYRMFGFERVADHYVARFPVNKLDFVPRCGSFIPVDTAERVEMAIDVYKRFSENRNLLPERLSDAYFTKGDLMGNGITYLHRTAAGVPDAFMRVSIEKELYVNHFRNGILHVKEIAYTTPEALRALFGFMRVFEGEIETVQLENIAMCREVDYMLRHYTHTTYETISDLSARVLDVTQMLVANHYPEEPGSFSLRVIDPYEVAGGAWRVDYGKGNVHIGELAKDDETDIVCNVAPLAPILYGAIDLTAQTLQYMDGVTVNRDPADFLRAFPKKPCGIFEHF